MLDLTQPPTIIYRLYVVPLHSNNNKKGLLENTHFDKIIPFLLKRGETTQIQITDSQSVTWRQH